MSARHQALDGPDQRACRRGSCHGDTIRHGVERHDDLGDNDVLDGAILQRAFRIENEASATAPHDFDATKTRREGVENSNRFCKSHGLTPKVSGAASFAGASSSSAIVGTTTYTDQHGYSILTPPDVPSHLRVGRLPCNTPEAPANLFSPWKVTPAPAWRAIK